MSLNKSIYLNIISKLLFTKCSGNTILKFNIGLLLTSSLNIKIGVITLVLPPPINNSYDVILLLLSL